MKTIRIKKFKSVDGCIYDTKRDALAADKQERIRLIREKCDHDFKEIHEIRRGDIGHHDYVDFNYRVDVCRLCKFRRDVNLGQRG